MTTLKNEIIQSFREKFILTHPALGGMRCLDCDSSEEEKIKNIKIVSQIYVNTAVKMDIVKLVISLKKEEFIISNKYEYLLYNFRNKSFR